MSLVIFVSRCVYVCVCRWTCCFKLVMSFIVILRLLPFAELLLAAVMITALDVTVVYSAFCTWCHVPQFVRNRGMGCLHAAALQIYKLNMVQSHKGDSTKMGRVPMEALGLRKWCRYRTARSCYPSRRQILLGFWEESFLIRTKALLCRFWGCG